METMVVDVDQETMVDIDDQSPAPLPAIAPPPETKKRGRPAGKGAVAKKTKATTE